jgi:hypothetical protein
MNNNLVSTNLNTWVGSTHIDNYKLTSNFIITTSNILENHSSNFTLNTSNILENHSSNFTSNTSNFLRNYFNKLIDNYDDSTNNLYFGAMNTHIYNSNVLGEIRFLTQGAPSYFGNDLKFMTKIQEDGQIAVYYVYNPIYPSVVGPKWYIVAEAIRDSYAFQATTGVLLGTIQQEINLLSGTVEGLEVSIISVNSSLLETIAEVRMIENSLGYTNIHNATTWSAAEIADIIKTARDGG